MMRPEPKSSPKPYPTATSPENILQQPENTITTCASVETQEIAKPLATTASHRSRSIGGVGGVEAGGGGGEREEGSDLDTQEKAGEGRPQIQIPPTYLIGVVLSFSSLDTWRSRNEGEREYGEREARALAASHRRRPSSLA